MGKKRSEDIAKCFCDKYDKIIDLINRYIENEDERQYLIDSIDDLIDYFSLFIQVVKKLL